MDAAQPQARVEIVRKGAWLQFFTPHDFAWRRFTIAIPGIAPSLNGLRIIHLTDLHFRPYWGKAYDEMLRAIREAKPDLICITGDFVESKWNRAPALPFVRRFVEGLEARAGVYGVLGNHDTDFMTMHLADGKMTLLYRAHAELRAHNGMVELIGVPGVGRIDLDDDFLHHLPPHEPAALRIALGHYPDQIKRLSRVKPQLMFAGHTHGGQICLPGGIPIMTHDALPKHQSHGVHRIDDTWLIVSRGIGFSTLPVRVFCPAEVVEIVVEAI
jgi:predicted MPP superfamily phosphohydrolase